MDQNCDEANDFDQDGDGVITDYGGNDCFDDDSTEDCICTDLVSHITTCDQTGQYGPLY